MKVKSIRNVVYDETFRCCFLDIDAKGHLIKGSYIDIIKDGITIYKNTNIADIVNKEGYFTIQINERIKYKHIGCLIRKSRCCRLCHKPGNVRSHKHSIVETVLYEMINEVINKNDKINDILTKSKKQNKGETGENNIIKYLFINRNNKAIITIIFNINSCIILIDPKTRKEILSLENISKSSGYYKSDIIIHFIEVNIIYHVSIKCNDGSPPTLLNHTNRSCDYFQNKLQCEQLKILDSVVIKRNNMKKQDVNFNDIKDLLTNEELNCLINIISYFTFDGTGSSKSKCPADSIFIVDNSSDILSSYKFIVCKEDIQKKEYIKSILSNLRICMRGGKHGLPGKTNYDKDMVLCEPWLFYDTKNKPCVAIHIRYI